jgi:hypothetical protein
MIKITYELNGGKFSREFSSQQEADTFASALKDDTGKPNTPFEKTGKIDILTPVVVFDYVKAEEDRSKAQLAELKLENTTEVNVIDKQPITQVINVVSPVLGAKSGLAVTNSVNVSTTVLGGSIASGTTGTSISNTASSSATVSSQTSIKKLGASSFPVRKLGENDQDFAARVLNLAAKKD